MKNKKNVEITLDGFIINAEMFTRFGDIRLNKRSLKLKKADSNENFKGFRFKTKRDARIITAMLKSQYAIDNPAIIEGL